MKFGYLSTNTAEGIRPDAVAIELEARGFESLWLPEHPSIPISRQSSYGTGEDLPEGYLHMMDEFVSLTASAMVTSTLRLGTGLCLVLEHDLIDLAVKATTLDVLSDGRLTLGVGFGWNAEELADHQPDLPFRLRYSATTERIQALRAAWSADPVFFEGSHIRISEFWINPKPRQGTIPIGLGSGGPIGMSLAASFADQWFPLNIALVNNEGKYDPVEVVHRFRDLVESAGRDPSTVDITVFCIHLPRPVDLQLFNEASISRVAPFPKQMVQHPADITLRQLDELAALVSTSEVAG